MFFLFFFFPFFSCFSSENDLIPCPQQQWETLHGGASLSYSVSKTMSPQLWQGKTAAYSPWSVWPAQGDPISKKLRQAKPSCSRILSRGGWFPCVIASECHYLGRTGAPAPVLTLAPPSPRVLSRVMQETGDEELRKYGVISTASIIHGRQPTLDLGPSSGSGGLTLPGDGQHYSRPCE